jgi:hypothetical protein
LWADDQNRDPLVKTTKRPETTLRPAKGTGARDRSEHVEVFASEKIVEMLANEACCLG